MSLTSQAWLLRQQRPGKVGLRRGDNEEGSQVLVRPAPRGGGRGSVCVYRLHIRLYSAPPVAAIAGAGHRPSSRHATELGVTQHARMSSFSHTVIILQLISAKLMSRWLGQSRPSRTGSLATAASPLGVVHCGDAVGGRRVGGGPPALPGWRGGTGPRLQMWVRRRHVLLWRCWCTSTISGARVGTRGPPCWSRRGRAVYPAVRRRRRAAQPLPAAACPRPLGDEHADALGAPRGTHPGGTDRAAMLAAPAAAPMRASIGIPRLAGHVRSLLTSESTEPSATAGGDGQWGIAKKAAVAAGWGGGW